MGFSSGERGWRGWGRLGMRLPRQRGLGCGTASLCPCDSPAWGGKEGGGSQPGGLLLSLTCEGRGLHQGVPPHTPAWDTGGSHPQPPLSLLHQSSSLPPSLPSPALMEVPSGHLKIIKRRLKFLLCPFTVGFPAGKQGDLFRDCNIA